MRPPNTNSIAQTGNRPSLIGSLLDTCHRRRLIGTIRAAKTKTGNAKQQHKKNIKELSVSGWGIPVTIPLAVACHCGGGRLEGERQWGSAHET